jgi:hypothetical protein
MMWLRSTIAPMMTLDHLELKYCGAFAVVKIEDLVNLISLAYNLRGLRVLWRLLVQTDFPVLTRGNLTH